MAQIIRDNWCRPRRAPGGTSCCVRVESPIKRPDPATYSQAEQLAAGAVPSWNSPDITTNHWSPFRLYQEPEVRVRNLSGEVNAVGVQVRVSTSAFGIGMPRKPLGTQIVDLAPNQAVWLRFPLTQDILGGEQRIGTYVQVVHSKDANPANNRGDQIHDGRKTSESGRTLEFSLPVLNNQNAPRTINLVVLANDLSASVTPNSHNFAAFEQINARLRLVVPGSLHGSSDNPIEKEVTVIGRDAAGVIVDGATFVVRVDD